MKQAIFIGQRPAVSEPVYSCFQQEQFRGANTYLGIRKTGAVSACLLLTVVTLFVLSNKSAEAQLQYVPTLNTVAGTGVSGSTGDGGLATLGTISSGVRGVATDRQGNMYIADNTSEVVRRVDARTGIITTVAGTGTGGFSGDGGLATQAKLANPRYVAVDASNNLYIADQSNARIRMVSAATGIITTLAGNGTVCSSTTATCGDGGAATSAQLSQNLAGIAVDPSGNVYFNDAGNRRVRKVSGGSISTYAGTGALCGGGTGSGICGDGSAATSATFITLVGLALDAYGNVYVTDNGAYRLRMIQASTGTITTIAGTGAAGTGGIGGPAASAQFTTPYHVATDSKGDIFVADSGVTRVYEVIATTAGASPVFGNMVAVAGTGSGGSTGDGGLPLLAKLAGNFGVNIDPFGNLLIADVSNFKIRKAALSQPFAETAVGVSTPPTLNLNATLGAADTLSSLTIPAAFKDFTVGTSSCALGTSLSSGTTCTAPVTFAPSYPGLRTAPVTFTDASSVKFTAGVSGYATAPAIAFTPGTISTAAGTGSSGYTGDSGAASAATLNAAYSSAVDSAGNLYIADTGNNAIRLVSKSTGNISTFYATGLSGPKGVALDAAGNVYIADTGNSVVRVINASTGVASVLAGTAGTPGYSGDGSAATNAKLTAPTGLDVDYSGFLYIADTGNNAVRVVNLATGTIATVAGTGTACASATAACGDAALATSAQLNAPQGVFYLPPPVTESDSLTMTQMSAQLLIADTGDNRIRAVNLNSGLIATVAGTGATGLSGNGAAATAAALTAPTAVVADAATNLYIADSGNHVVRQVTQANGFITAVAGTGTAGYAGDAGSALAATVTNPTGIAVDSGANIFITDPGANVVRKVDVTHAATVAFGSQTVTGSAGGTLVVTATNTGNQLLTFTGLSFSSPVFQQTSYSQSDCSASGTLAAGAACTIGITFNPTAGGPVTATLTNTDNALGVSGATQATSITGTGLLLATSLSATSPSGSAAAGSAISTTLTAMNGTFVTPGYTGTVHFTSSDPNPNIILPSNYTFTSTDAGSHLFTGIQLLTVGTQTITITDTANSLLATTISVTVVAGTPASIVATVGTPQNGQINDPYAVLFKVLLEDAYANPVSGATVTFTAPSSGASGLFGSSLTTTAVTDATGSATAGTFTANGTLGSFTVNATAVGVSTPAAFHLQNVPNQIATTVTVTDTPTGPIVYGQSSVVVNASITPTNSGGSSPTGTLTFFDGSTKLATATVASAGASTTIVGPTAGTHSLTASYSGDTVFAGSTSAPSIFTVNQSSTTLTAAPITVGFGQSGSGTVTIAGQYTGTGISLPSGTITYQIGSGSPATAAITAGVATLAVPTTLAPGTYTVSLTYGGDTNYKSQTGSLTLTVQKVTPSITLTSSLTPNPINTALTLTAKVTSTSGTPTGSVTFMDGTTTLFSSNLIGGVATLSISTLTGGSHSITAIYSGDVDFAAVTSAPLAQVISVPSFTSTASTQALTVTQGQIGVVNLTVTPILNWAGLVTYTCSGLPNYSACVFNTINATPAITAAAASSVCGSATEVNQICLVGNNVSETVTVSIVTMGINGTYAKAASPREVTKLSYAALLPVLAFISGLVFASRRRRMKLSGMARLMLFQSLFLIGLGWFTGCGGEGLKPTAPTPAGTSNVTITMTGSGTSAITQQATVALTVQAAQ